MAGKKGMRSKRVAVIKAKRSLALRNGKKLDGRTRDVRLMKATLIQLCEDLGGADELSMQQRLLAGECAWQAARLRRMKEEHKHGGAFDDMRYSAILNSLLGMLRTLGIERKAKRAESFRDVVTK